MDTDKTIVRLMSRINLPLVKDDPAANAASTCFLCLIKARMPRANAEADQKVEGTPRNSYEPPYTSVTTPIRTGHIHIKKYVARVFTVAGRQPNPIMMLYRCP